MAKLHVFKFVFVCVIFFLFTCYYVIFVHVLNCFFNGNIFVRKFLLITECKNMENDVFGDDFMAICRLLPYI